MFVTYATYVNGSMASVVTAHRATSMCGLWYHIPVDDAKLWCTSM